MLHTAISICFWRLRRRILHYQLRRRILPSGSSFRMAQKSQLSQLLNHIMYWPKSWTHPADDDNNRNDRSISHPGCTCGGDGIWVHGTGCLTCTKLRGPEDLLVFSSTQNSDTGTHDAQIAPYLACGSICFARTLHISFLNQTSSTSAPYLLLKYPNIQC